VKNIAVKIIDQDDDGALVGGYGVLFGGLDLQDEGFDDSTDFMLDLVPTKKITYDHTLQATSRDTAIKHFLGETTKETKDDVGIWVEAQIDKSKQYVKQVLQLIEKGLIGWSSGTAAHLATKEGKTITRWPIVEYALTPTPAEPRALGVVRLKSLATNSPGLQAFLAKNPIEGLSPGAMAGSQILQVKARAFLLVSESENQK
jgi:hypothetical protein